MGNGRNVLVVVPEEGAEEVLCGRRGIIVTAVLCLLWLVILLLLLLLVLIIRIIQRLDVEIIAASGNRMLLIEQRGWF